MRQKPVYILNHNTNQMQPRSMIETLDELEGFSAHLARKMWEGSGLTPSLASQTRAATRYYLLTGERRFRGSGRGSKLCTR